MPGITDHIYPEPDLKQDRPAQIAEHKAGGHNVGHRGTMVFFVITRALWIAHFHLFVGAGINIVYTLGGLIGLVWLIRRPSTEPLILLIVFNTLSILLHWIVLSYLALEHETSMIIIALCLKSTTLYYLIKAVPKVREEHALR